MIIYKLICKLVAGYYRVIYLASVKGRENIPREGGLLLCSNHKSNNDPPFIASFVPRQIKFLAKKELFDIPGLGFLIKHLGAIPLDRHKADTAAVKASMSIMRSGLGLLVFPQGGRRQSIQLRDIHPGSVAMAQRAGVPVIPVGISGKYRPFGGLTLRFGKPITCAELARLEKRAGEEKNKAFAELIYNRIGSLANE